MPLVAAICPQCNGTIEVDSNKKTAICKYCKQPFVIEEAINHYNITNITNIDNLRADVVNISNGQSRDDFVRSGDTFIMLKQYGKAAEVFGKLKNEAPYDYRGWWGLVRANSENLTRYNISGLRFKDIEDLYENAYAVASDDEKNIINSQFEDYANQVRNNLMNLRNNTEREIKQCSAEFEHYKYNFEQRIGVLSSQMERLIRPSNVIGIVLGVAVLILGFIGLFEGGIELLALAIIAFGAIAYGIYYILGIILNPFYDMKNKRIEEQKKALIEEYRLKKQQYDKKIEELKKIMDRVADI